MKYKKELKNERIIKEKVFYYENTEYKVLITKDIKPDSYNELYYNIYVTNEYFIEEAMNNLHLQEPKELLKDSDFNLEYCEIKALEFYLWFKYSNNENVKSYYIEVHQD